MCIRDRTLNAAGVSAKREGQQARALAIEGKKTAKEQAIACLLYTSDAADERSSVDLGGRRIIKKKKQTIIVRSGCTVTKNTQVRRMQ